MELIKEIKKEEFDLLPSFIKNGCESLNEVNNNIKRNLIYYLEENVTILN